MLRLNKKEKNKYKQQTRQPFSPTHLATNKVGNNGLPITDKKKRKKKNKTKSDRPRYPHTLPKAKCVNIGAYVDRNKKNIQVSLNALTHTLCLGKVGEMRGTLKLTKQK